jgi:nucleoside-diphosphate-sugar epimerase
MTFRLLITGANGFLGRCLCEESKNLGFIVRAATRTPYNFSEGIENIVVGDIDAHTDWTKALLDCDAVIHLAAHVHVMCEKKTDTVDEFRRTNVFGTKQLAQSAAINRVKRFVFISSIGVNGLFTKGDAKFSEGNTPAPYNPYTISKWEAEVMLKTISKETNLEIVVVRPPLIYGLGAPGNFDQMLKILSKNIPLPFLRVTNKRDFVYVKNLVSALISCATHPKAAGKTYLVSDGEAISTADLLSYLSEALGNPIKLFGMPLWMLKLIGKVTRKNTEIEKLLSSLQINSSKIRDDLGWIPPYSVRDGLKESIKR